jgi:HD-GYP domain-containing protein (c-di-GMP phosphodiesterase class II)
MAAPGYRIRLFVGVVASIALSLGAVLVLHNGTVNRPLVVLALALIAALSERSSIRFGRTTSFSTSQIPTLFAAVLFGPLAGGIVGASSMLGDAETYSRSDPERAPRLKFLLYASTRFIVGVVMAGTARVASDLVPSRIGELVIGTLAGAIVGELLGVLDAGLAAQMRGRSLQGFARSVAPVVFTSAPTYAPIVAALAIAYDEVSPWTAPLFFVPALAAHRLYHLYQEQRRLADNLAEANETLARANLSFASGLIATLDARDRYTAGHSAAVAIYCRDIARRMDLAPDLQEQAYLCGLVHDIGKIGLPPGLLEKPGALTLEERRQMQEHSAIGEHILMQVDTYADIANIVRFHHERIDGEGYPDGLRGDEIPLLSRIIAVADAYNAMTSDRPYRDAMPSRVARHRLAQAVESQFDTAVIAAFEAILAGADEDYRLARRSDFTSLTRQSYPSSELDVPTPVAISVA